MHTHTLILTQVNFIPVKVFMAATFYARNLHEKMVYTVDESKER